MLYIVQIVVQLSSWILEDIFKNLLWYRKSINVDGKRFNNLRFADDIILISSHLEELEALVPFGLKMNISKTKFMCPNNSPMTINNQAIESVEKCISRAQHQAGKRKSNVRENKTNWPNLDGIRKTQLHPKKPENSH